MTSIRAHDFRPTDTLDRQHVRALSAAFETFARHASVELSTLLRKATQISIGALREMQWREIVEIHGERPYLATFNLEPLHGAAVVLLSLATSVRMLDFRLGGGTQPGFAGHTELTDTDFTVLAGVITPLLTELATSLSRVAAVSSNLVSQESSVQFVQFAGANEMFLVATFQLAMADDAAVEMTFALPFALVRQITESMRSGSFAHEGASRLVDEPTVLRAGVGVWLEIPPVRLSSYEVADVKVGDVIRFHHALRQPLDLHAEGVLVARARHGAVGSKVVCSILEEVATNDG